MRYPWAVPGRKVVCVDGSLETSGPPPHGCRWAGKVEVMAGETYTIRSIQINPRSSRLCVLLVELADRSLWDNGYWVGRFRPLHTVEGDVALFAELLTPAPNAPMLPARTTKEPMGQ